MEIAEQFAARRQIETREVKNYDATILLGYSVFAIVFLIAIYFDSMSPGIALAGFATTVLP